MTRTKYYRAHTLDCDICRNRVKHFLHLTRACPCGNNADNGYFPCTESGVIMETTDSEWTGQCVCPECGEFYRLEPLPTRTINADFSRPFLKVQP